MTKKIAGTIAVLVHLAVVLLHGRAHEDLRVGLNAWQNVFVLVVIVVTPLIAMLLVWTRLSHVGFWFLTISMAGSLIFGAVYHYLIISPDHVMHLPLGAAQGVFRMTAALLILTELFGVVVGLWALRRNNRVYS